MNAEHFYFYSFFERVQNLCTREKILIKIILYGKNGKTELLSDLEAFWTLV